MIRAIEDKEDPFDYLKRAQERLLALENLLSTHITWFTHKNPYGCTICDLIQLCQTGLLSFESFLGPSEQNTEDTNSEDRED